MSSTTLEAVVSPSAVQAKEDANEIILSVRGVSKHYNLWDSPSERLHYSLLSQAHRTLRRVLPSNSGPLEALRRRRDALHKDFMALEELSFDVRRGESLGIIGRNGAGKSTLLQIIAGTLNPSTGYVEVYGRVAALLELGSGFNPEYTGKENVYLNASTLGFSKAEIDAKFDEIAAFADIGQFLDQPVKTYSSGMMVRLAFSVQMAIEPSLFIIDEALAVGDIYFQSKCNKILRQKLDAGMTLLLVSHNPAAVRALCQRGLVLDRGRRAFLGPSDQAVNVYHELGDRRGEPTTPEVAALEEEKDEDTASAMELSPIGQFEDQIGSREIVVTGYGLFNQKGEARRDFLVGEPIHAGFSFRSQIDAAGVLAGFVIRDRYGNAVTALTTANQQLDPLSVRRGKTYRVFLTLLGRLGQGEYLLDFGIGGQSNLVGSPDLHYHRIGGIATFTVGWHDREIYFQGMCDVGAEFRWADN